MMQPTIPQVDPIPLPAPYWLFKVLLIVTFVLHILAMNFMFGGAILAFVARLKGKKDPTYLRLSQDVVKKIPSFLAATITLGVAPLLFVQVLFGQYFYTSSILMAWPWFLVIPLLTLAYYGLYIVAFSGEKKAASHTWILLGSVVFLFLIGFFYTSNFTLMLHPEAWSSKYFADPSGWNLNWGDPQLIPRDLHFVVAATAIAGLMVAFTGFFKWNRDRAYARLLMDYGSRWYLYGTLAQFVVGIVFLLALPKEKMMLFMGKDVPATLLLWMAVILAVGAVVAVGRGLRRDDPRPQLRLAMWLTAVVVLFMAIARDILRMAFLPSFRPEQLQVQTQYSVLALFLILFVAGGILWVVMIRRYFAFSHADEA